LECQVASLANIASNYLIKGKEAKRMGTQHSSIVPYQSFGTKDAYLTIGAGNDSQYLKLCSAIERKDLISSEYETNILRVKNRQRLIPELQKTFKSKTTKEWLEILDDTGLPFGPINTIKQTFEHPQVLARNMIETVDHKLGQIKLVGIPVKYSESKPKIRMPPPMLGEHTVEVLEGLGYSSVEIERLKADKVV
jgi:succinate---hydroxymethylglutarate CoA-transferase